MTKYFILILIIILTACSSSRRSIDQSKELKNRYNNSDSVIKSKIVVGLASYYSDKYHGKKTANGEIYDMNGLSAAHTYYPFGTIIKVTNLTNKKSVVVRVNDRMPKHRNRIIDLSLGAAKELDMIRSGVIKVRLEIIKWGE